MQASLRQAPARLPFATLMASGSMNVAIYAPGDVFSVAAGAAHRFKDFSADVATWVVFDGPQDGG